MKKNKAGFTLVELMVVMVIIVLIVIPAIVGVIVIKGCNHVRDNGGIKAVAEEIWEGSDTNAPDTNAPIAVVPE